MSYIEAFVGLLATVGIVLLLISNPNIITQVVSYLTKTVGSVLSLGESAAS